MKIYLLEGSKIFYVKKRDIVYSTIEDLYNEYNNSKMLVCNIENSETKEVNILNIEVNKGISELFMSVTTNSGANFNIYHNQKLPVKIIKDKIVTKYFNQVTNVNTLVSYSLNEELSDGDLESYRNGIDYFRQLEDKKNIDDFVINDIINTDRTFIKSIIDKFVEFNGQKRGNLYVLNNPNEDTINNMIILCKILNFGFKRTNKSFIINTKLCKRNYKYDRIKTIFPLIIDNKNIYVLEIDSKDEYLILPNGILLE